MTNPGSSVFLGNNWRLAIAKESTYGTDPGTASYTNVLGVVQTVTMPDPSINWASFWGMTSTSNRNWSISYPGPITLSGSIPDIILLDGRALSYAIGTVATTGGPAYTHTISEANTLNSLALHLSVYGSGYPGDSSTPFMRRYLGGKVNRATIKASEGDYLRLALDEINFVNFSHNQVGMPWYSANVAEITPTYPSNEPYYFSMGSLSLDGVTFARIRNISISMSNSMDGKFYVQNTGGSLLPYEYREGQRQYSITTQIDIADAALYNELVQMGNYSNVFKGFQIVLTFTRGTNDTITMTMPGSAPAAGLDAVGSLFTSAPHNVVQDPVVSVQCSMISRNLSIVVVDSISSY